MPDGNRGLSQSKNVRAEKVTGDLWSQKVKCVCNSCNNGWMSQIQNRAKFVLESILIPPTTSSAKFELIQSELKTIVQWISMTTITQDLAFGAHSAISQGNRDCFYNTKFPPSFWKIWIGNYDGTGWTRKMRHTSGYYSINNGKWPETPNMHVSTIAVPPLYMSVFSQQQDAVNYVCKHPGLVQIWPNVPLSITWPPSESITDDDADQMAKFFHDMLGKVERKLPNGLRRAKPSGQRFYQK